MPMRADRRTNGLPQFGQRCLRSSDSSRIIWQSSMTRRPDSAQQIGEILSAKFKSVAGGVRPKASKLRKLKTSRARTRGTEVSHVRLENLPRVGYVLIAHRAE